MSSNGNLNFDPCQNDFALLQDKLIPLGGGMLGCSQIG